MAGGAGAPRPDTLAPQDRPALARGPEGGSVAPTTSQRRSVLRLLLPRRVWEGCSAALQTHSAVGQMVVREVRQAP
eukprot:14843975-Alexandrium_andersonii.AAC.1